jgi:hypothetical protein
MIRRSLVLIGGVLLVGAASAHAQDSFRLDANIPFEFQAGRQTLPAGENLLTLDQGEEPGVLKIRSRQGHAAELLLMMPTEATRATREGRLVFEHSGDAYVLTEVFAEGARVGGEVLRTHPSEERPRTAD